MSCNERRGFSRYVHKQLCLVFLFIIRFLLAVCATLTPSAFKYLAGERLKGKICNSDTCVYMCKWHKVMRELSALIEKQYFTASFSTRSAMKLFVNWPAWENVGTEWKQLPAGCVAMCFSTTALIAEHHECSQTAAANPTQDGLLSKERCACRWGSSSRLSLPTPPHLPGSRLLRGSTSTCSFISLFYLFLFLKHIHIFH